MAERMSMSGGERLLAGVMFLLFMAGVLLGDASPIALSSGTALHAAVRHQLSLGADLVRGILFPEPTLSGRLAPAYGILYASLAGPDATLRVADSAGLAAAFQELGYHLDSAACCTREVPRVMLSRLPADFPTLAASGARKTKFLEVLLPLVIAINEEILAERGRLLAIRAHLEAGESVTLDERYWLMRLAERYGGDAEALDDLLARVDVIPPSLALAQAAVESGWGSSAYALADNAPFGQYTGSASDGQAPTAARNGTFLHIRSFPELLDAVRAYARNLDSHPAYRGFRALRAKERQAGQALDGDKLAATLSRYSSRGSGYVRDLRRVMRANALKQFDAARLADRAPTLVVLDRG